jgi:hypothetical protein
VSTGAYPVRLPARQRSPAAHHLPVGFLAARPVGQLPARWVPNRRFSLLLHTNAPIARKVSQPEAATPPCVTRIPLRMDRTQENCWQCGSFTTIFPVPARTGEHLPFRGNTGAVMACPVRLTHERLTGTMRRGADSAFGNVRC